MKIGMYVIKDIIIHEKKYDLSRRRKMIEHHKNKGVQEKSKVMEGRSKIKDYDKNGEEGVTHTRVFVKVDVSPKCSDEESNITDYPEDSVNSND